MLLSQVRDPGNAGTVIRGADAAGADAVLVSEASVDVHSPKVVRSTAGSLFHLPVVTGLEVAGARSRRSAAHGIRCVRRRRVSGPPCCPTPTSTSRTAGSWATRRGACPSRPCAACDDVVRVPIHGLAESLNLAMAATVCLYASAGRGGADRASR